MNSTSLAVSRLYIKTLVDPDHSWPVLESQEPAATHLPHPLCLSTLATSFFLEIHELIHTVGLSTGYSLSLKCSFLLVFASLGTWVTFTCQLLRKSFLGHRSGSHSVTLSCIKSSESLFTTLSSLSPGAAIFTCGCVSPGTDSPERRA